MSELFVIAGPQAAGKSTAIRHINEQYQGISPLFKRNRGHTPILFPLQESRQIIVHKHMLLGAIFMDFRHEVEVIECDFRRMDTIEKRRGDNVVYLDECNIFTIAHAKAHGISSIDAAWNEYIERLRKLNARVIFLDIPPELSWERRSRKYAQRLIYFPKSQHPKIMASYKDYLMKIYPLLKEIYERLPLPKCLIDARQSSKMVLESVSAAMSKLSTTFR